MHVPCRVGRLRCVPWRGVRDKGICGRGAGGAVLRGAGVPAVAPHAGGLAVLGCGFALVHGAAGFVYARSGVVTPELRQTAEMPTSFWVMMGLGEPDGAYSVEDEREIMYRQTKEERQAYAAEVIRTRLEEKGTAGLSAFLMRKTARTFGAGNGEIYYSLSRGRCSRAMLSIRTFWRTARIFACSIMRRSAFTCRSIFWALPVR